MGSEQEDSPELAACRRFLEQDLRLNKPLTSQADALLRGLLRWKREQWMYSSDRVKMLDDLDDLLCEERSR